MHTSIRYRNIAFLIIGLHLFLSLGALDSRTLLPVTLATTPIYGDEAFQARVKSYLEPLGDRNLIHWLYTIRGLHVSFAPSTGCPGAMCAFNHYGDTYMIGIQPDLDISPDMGAAMILHELVHLRDMRADRPVDEHTAYLAMQSEFLDLTQFERDWIEIQVTARSFP